MKYPALLTTIVGLCSLVSSIASAQSAASTATDVDQKAAPLDRKSPDDWKFGVSVYGWLTNLSGSATARGQTVDINASFIDIIQKSDSLAAFDGHFEADKGRFGLYGDLVWASLGIPLSATAYRNPIAGLKLSAQANAAVTTTLTIAEAGALYEVAKWPGSDQSFTALDVKAGARLWNISAEIAMDVSGALNFSRVFLSRFDQVRNIAFFDSGSQTWADPLVGLRLRHQFTPSQQVFLESDVGGFGIQGSSAISWQAAAIYSYTWQYTGWSLAAIGGYRALSTNISFNDGSPGGSNLNLVIHGPVVGLTVKF